MAISPWHLLSVIRCDDAASLLADFDPAVHTIDSYRFNKYEQYRRVMVEESQLGHLRPIKVLVSDDEVPEYTDSYVPKLIVQSWREISPLEDEWLHYSFDIIRLSFERAELYRWLRTKFDDPEIPDALRLRPGAESRVLEEDRSGCGDAEECGIADRSGGLESQQSFFSHESEGLRLVTKVIEQFWSSYDPDQPATAPSSIEIKNYLIEQGVSDRLANAVDRVCRPFSLQKAGLKQNRPGRR